jgi:hypothetical protein
VHAYGLFIVIWSVHRMPPRRKAITRLQALEEAVSSTPEFGPEQEAPQGGPAKNIIGQALGKMAEILQ